MESKVIRIDKNVFENLKEHAEPLDDTPSSVIEKILNSHHDMLEILIDIEWASNNIDENNRLVSMCPYCKGINPNDKFKQGFMKNLHGHRLDCEIMKTITKNK